MNDMNNTTCGVSSMRVLAQDRARACAALLVRLQTLEASLLDEDAAALWAREQQNGQNRQQHTDDTDDALWDALQKRHMADNVRQAGTGGLDADASVGGRSKQQGVDAMRADLAPLFRDRILATRVLAEAAAVAADALLEFVLDVPDVPDAPPSASANVSGRARELCRRSADALTDAEDADAILAALAQDAHSVVLILKMDHPAWFACVAFLAAQPLSSHESHPSYERLSMALAFMRASLLVPDATWPLAARPTARTILRALYRISEETRKRDRCMQSEQSKQTLRCIEDGILFLLRVALQQEGPLAVASLANNADPTTGYNLACWAAGNGASRVLTFLGTRLPVFSVNVGVIDSDSARFFWIHFSVSPMTLAVLHRHTACVRALLAHFSPRNLDLDGASVSFPLVVAAQSGSNEAVRILLDDAACASVDVNAVNRVGQSALIAAAFRHYDTLCVMLDSRAFAQGRLVLPPDFLPRVLYDFMHPYRNDMLLRLLALPAGSLDLFATHLGRTALHLAPDSLVLRQAMRRQWVQYAWLHAKVWLGWLPRLSV